MVTLAPGDKLVVAVGGKSPRLAMNGTFVDAFQVTYWFAAKDMPRPIPFHNEWIEAESGRLVQSVHLHEKLFPAGFRHQARLSRYDWPPAMLATLAAGLPPGSFEFKPAAEWVDPLNSATAKPFTGSMSLPDATCQVTLRMETAFEAKTYPERDYEVAFGPDHGMPLRFSAKAAVPNPWDLDLRLDASTLGTGEPLPAFSLNPAPQPSTRLSMREAGNGFLPGQSVDLPTSFDQALEAMKGDLRAGRWLQDHPDALPSEVTHQLGETNSTVVDQWVVNWWSATGGQQITVDRVRDSLLPLGLGTYQVFSLEKQNEEPRRSARVDLAQMEALVHEVYGKPLEAIQCSFYKEQCNFGDHASTGIPYALRSGTSLPGLMVDVRRGLVIQEASFSEAAVGPPVPFG